MKTIYLVVEVTWEDRFPHKAFASKRKAEAFAAAEREEALKDARRTSDSIWSIDVEELEYEETT